MALQPGGAVREGEGAGLCGVGRGLGKLGWPCFDFKTNIHDGSTLQMGAKLISRG